MNERANELGMKNTSFKNVTGLDDTDDGHLSSARDIAIMSRELMKHETVLNYTTIWMDTIRNGQFGLTNTNRLIRFYPGANGLKTGSTSKAKFCISAAAKRDGMQLIAVIMTSPTRDKRNEAAKALLDFGFANYGIYTAEAQQLPSIDIIGSDIRTLPVSHSSASSLVERSRIKDIRYEIKLPEQLQAPVKKGDKVGEIVFYCGEEKINAVDITADCDAEKISFLKTFLLLLDKFLMS